MNECPCPDFLLYFERTDNATQNIYNGISIYIMYTRIRTEKTNNCRTSNNTWFTSQINRLVTLHISKYHQPANPDASFTSLFFQPLKIYNLQKILYTSILQRTQTPLQAYHHCHHLPRICSSRVQTLPYLLVLLLQVMELHQQYSYPSQNG